MLLLFAVWFDALAITLLSSSAGSIDGSPTLCIDATQALAARYQLGQLR